MGTNYYLYEKEDCPNCGANNEPRHIGKSSMGWVFGLHVDDEIKNLGNWKDQFFRPSTIIKNEYGDLIPPHDMVDIIELRMSKKNFDNKPYAYDSWEQFHKQNHSEEGPKGLLRHQVDGSHCVGHGEGTYDYIAGEFS